MSFVNADQDFVRGEGVMTDLQVENHGSLFLLTPMTEVGKEWIAEHIGAVADGLGVD
jgi:hypothetical protein